MCVDSEETMKKRSAESLELEQVEQTKIQAQLDEEREFAAYALYSFLT